MITLTEVIRYAIFLGLYTKYFSGSKELSEGEKSFTHESFFFLVCVADRRNRVEYEFLIIGTNTAK